MPSSLANSSLLAMQSLTHETNQINAKNNLRLTCPSDSPLFGCLAPHRAGAVELVLPANRITYSPISHSTSPTAYQSRIIITSSRLRTSPVG